MASPQRMKKVPHEESKNEKTEEEVNGDQIPIHNKTSDIKDLTPIQNETSGIMESNSKRSIQENLQSDPQPVDKIMNASANGHPKNEMEIHETSKKVPLQKAVGFDVQVVKKDHTNKVTSSFNNDDKF